MYVIYVYVFNFFQEKQIEEEDEVSFIEKFSLKLNFNIESIIF